jgi:adenine-specific DNA-methyltransferase
MSERKSTGSYYTPDYLARFVVQYLLPEVAQSAEPITFLEPSAGDGEFVNALLEGLVETGIANSVRIRTVERERKESAKVKKLVRNPQCGKVAADCIVGDFLEVQKGLQPGYRLICGNPPYLNKKRLTKKQIDACAKINADSEIPAFISNIWPAFVLRSAQLLSDDGVMAFVLPAEILQVKYAIVVKEYLYKFFKRIEVFEFKELLFDAKGQGTVLLIGYKTPCKPEGIYFTNVSDARALETQSFEFKEQKTAIVDGFRVKESHYDLPADDVALLFLIRHELQSLQHYANSKPGVVTAANDFFIVNNETLDNYDLKAFSKPIIQKGSLVNGKVEFTQHDFDKLSTEGIPTFLLDFNRHTVPTDKALEYLRTGEGRKIDKRYKCLQRERWYDIPNVSGPGEALFFKRSHHYPKLLKNTANVLVTDSAYKVALKQGYDLDSFVFSFYNSFTLAFAEMEGRHYGGGVLELVPSEFKRLPMIYTTVEKAEFDRYAERFKKKKSIEEVLIANDEVILRGIPHVDADIIATIQRVRQQLLDRRLRV